MNRRNFLRANGSICAGLALSRALPLLADTPSTTGWRTFEVVTRVELLKPEGESHIWLPAPLIRDTAYQKTISAEFKAEGGTAKLSKDEQNALGIVSAAYPANARPALTLTSRVSTKNYAVDLSSRGTAPPASRAELDYFLKPSQFVPIDGIVKETALTATAGANTDMEKARAIYEWVVEHTFRDPKVRGCGRGDIRFMLESGDMGGKCADLNALYVAWPVPWVYPRGMCTGCALRNRRWATRAWGWPPIKRRRVSTAAWRSICATMDGCPWIRPMCGKWL